MSEDRIGYGAPTVEGMILILRGQKVILDSDLARIYGVPTFRLNEAVKRNRDRFPEDFLFQLTKTEFGGLISQIAISKKGRGGVRKLPWAFTEHGAIMAATILNSRQAVKMSVFVIRAFVRLREALALHKDLARKLEDLEKKVGVHDTQIQAVFDALRVLIQTPEKPKRRIGFLEEPKARSVAASSRDTCLECAGPGAEFMTPQTGTGHLPGSIEVEHSFSVPSVAAEGGLW